LDELIQADVIRKRSTTIGGMKARNTYAIRFNPPPGTPAANGLGDLLAPLKEIASDPKAMSRAAKEVRATINERREREKQARAGQPSKTAGRAVPRKAGYVPQNPGVRTPENRGGTIRRSNKTKVFLFFPRARKLRRRLGLGAARRRKRRRRPTRRSGVTQRHPAPRHPRTAPSASSSTASPTTPPPRTKPAPSSPTSAPKPPSAAPRSPASTSGSTAATPTPSGTTSPTSAHKPPTRAQAAASTAAKPSPAACAPSPRQSATLSRFSPSSNA